MSTSAFSKDMFLFLALFVGVCACQGGDRIIFRDDDDDERMLFDTGSNRGRGSEIPESLLIQMKDVHNASEFLTRFVPGSGVDQETVENASSSVTGKRGLAAGAASMVSQFASCQTEQQVVELAKPEFGPVLLWPPCVRVRRCGGCCTSKMLACRPVAVSLYNVTVLQVRYNPDNPGAFEGEGQTIISLEQHDRCVCGCKQLPSDCVPGVHEYQESECRCACVNQSQAAECSGPLKIWDPNDCLCKCRRMRQCSTGFFFNVISCSCEAFRSSLASGSKRQSRSGSGTSSSAVSFANSSLSSGNTG